VIAGYIGYSELASARIARGDCHEHHERVASRLRAFLASWAVRPRPRRLCAPTQAVTRWWNVQRGWQGDALITLVKAVRCQGTASPRAPHVAARGDWILGCLGKL
jgi:hypothetical protein